MRKNARQIVELNCRYCHNSFKRFKKEYDRQIKRGRSKFYCNNTCSSKDNPALVKQTDYCKNHPQEVRLKLINSPNYHGRIKDEFSPFLKYISKIKQRNQSFHSSRETEITAEYLKEIWDKQNGVCPYTGLKMQLRDYSKPSSPANASVDRIDSTKGYIRDNIEFVCMSVNYAKNEFSKQEMLIFFKSINK